MMLSACPALPRFCSRHRDQDCPCPLVRALSSRLRQKSSRSSSAFPWCSKIVYFKIKIVPLENNLFLNYTENAIILPKYKQCGIFDETPCSIERKEGHGAIANRKSLSAKVIVLLTSVALVLSFIPCMALPQVALADETASGEATVFIVYTTDSDGSNQRVAKAYTQAELEALIDSAADAIAGQYVKGGSMGVWASDSYVTFADLLAGAGAAWGAGCTAKWGGTPEKPGNAFAYEQLQGRQFLPAAAVDKETGDITFSAAEIEGMNPAGKPYWTGTDSITVAAPLVFKVSAEPFANGYYKVTYTEGVFEGTIIAMNGEDMFRDSETKSSLL